jgi:PAS domain S-box-containing protein
MIANTELLEALPIAVYVADREGRLTYYNAAAAALWGYRPEAGSRWCGAWRLYWPDGRPMPHGDCPMAVTLKTGQMQSGDVVAERPDGSRVPVVAHPSLLRDGAGRITGAINLLIDVADRKQGEIDSARLAAIVSSSDDAIVGKALNGRVTSWNAAAARIFGYSAEEMIGQSILRIIPPELHPEEAEILARLRRGERIEHFDTVRVTRDGRRIDVSLTVSPIRDASGRVVGASKVARDVTERKRGEAMQRLLFDELNHRVKNTLAMIQAIAGQSLRRAASPEAFVASFNGRVQALARAHDVLVQGALAGADMAELVREQVVLGADEARIACGGPPVVLEPRIAVQLALVLHELATNARKHGALAGSGRLTVAWRIEPDRRELLLDWRECGVPRTGAPGAPGFGTTLIRRTLQANGGAATLEYGADGIHCVLRLPLPEEPATLPPAPAPAGAPAAEGRSSLQGRRILVVEDEPLVALEIEADLVTAGAVVIGPASTLEAAAGLIAEGRSEAAVLDANLAGLPVGALAAALARQGVPFVFATGYGHDGLPEGFRDRPVLYKPFEADQLLQMVRSLLAELPLRDASRVRPE